MVVDTAAWRPDRTDRTGEAALQESMHHVRVDVAERGVIERLWLRRENQMLAHGAADAAAVHFGHPRMHVRAEEVVECHLARRVGREDVSVAAGDDRLEDLPDRL